MDVPEWLVGRITVLPNGCWQWNGVPTQSGYGKVQVGGHPGRWWRAHRLVYTRMVGPIPDGLVLDHQCHNSDPSCPGGRACLHRRCVYPRHLVVTTQGENIRAGQTGHHGKSSRRCEHGGLTVRSCAECRREYDRARSLAHRSLVSA